MLLTPRVYQLASAPDRDLENTVAASPYIRLSPGWKTQRVQQKHAQKMLLVHQTGNVKVGEVVRYSSGFDSLGDALLLMTMLAALDTR
jgi:hypothetical protein